MRSVKFPLRTSFPLSRVNSVLKQTREGIYLSLHVIPGSARTEIAGLYGDKLKIKVKSPPAEGKANNEIIKFLGKIFSLKNKDIEIVKGKKSRSKQIFIKGCSKELIASLLAD